MKVLFMGTSSFALVALKLLVGEGHEVVCVLTKPQKKPTCVHQWAVLQGIPVRTPKALKDFSVPEADIGVVAAYGLLLPQPILESFPFGCVNIHPSLLPRWRGAAPIPRAILAGDVSTGVCIMRLDATLDTGKLMAVREATIAADDTTGSLTERLAQLGGALLLDVLDALHRGVAVAMPQKQAGVTYAKKLAPEEERLCWHKNTVVHLHRQIRALYPMPGAYTFFRGERLKILKAHPTLGAHDHAPGTLVDDHMTVACLDGYLTVECLQRAGGKRLSVRDFLRGTPIPPGTLLGEGDA